MGFFKNLARGSAALFTGGASEAARSKGGKKALGGVTDAIGITNHAGDAALAAQQAATRDANATTWAMFNQGRADQQPWRDAGAKSLGELSGQMGDLSRSFTMTDFQQDPGYQFRMDEGQKALERGAAAKGGLMGGGTLKALSRYGQDFASNEYTNAYNRFNNDRDQRYSKLSSLAGVGQSTSAQMANNGMQAGQQVAQNQIGMGNAQAANSMAQSNRLGNMIGQGAGIAAMFSDERLKTDIEPVSKEDLQELKDKVKAYKFKYKDQAHGEGDFIGVMAQQLEGTKLGKNLVGYDSEGYRYINTQKLMSLLLATLAGA